METKIKTSHTSIILDIARLQTKETKTPLTPNEVTALQDALWKHLARREAASSARLKRLKR